MPDIAALYLQNKTKYNPYSRRTDQLSPQNDWICGDFKVATGGLCLSCKNINYP